MKKNKNKQRIRRKKRKTQKIARAVTVAARRLLDNPAFLSNVCKKIGELGVIGEERNRLIVFLAGLTAILDTPVSIILKGSSASGKSNLLRTVVQLFPPECVRVLSSLSKRAPAYGEDRLDGLVLLLMEYRGGKDAQYLIRLMQSEGGIAHEATTVRGHQRSTTVTERSGQIVVLTTTTESTVFRDDETRFLSLWSDESEAQTQAILKALVRGKDRSTGREIVVFQEAVRLLRSRRVTYESPSWLEAVAECVPCSDVRVRRDWGRFLTFCKVIALSRIYRNDGDEKRTIAISFEDYCVAYELLNNAFSSTLRSVPEQAIQVAVAVRRFWTRHKRPVIGREIARRLGWKQGVTYKYLKIAEQRQLVDRKDAASRRDNMKPYVPGRVAARFLPTPQTVLDDHKELGRKRRYYNPTTDELVVLRRREK